MKHDPSFEDGSYDRQNQTLMEVEDDIAFCALERFAKL